MKNRPLINDISLFFGIFFLFASLSNLTELNYGFSDVGGGEAIGYNLVILVVYLIGPYLIFKSIKNKNKSREEFINNDKDNDDSIELNQTIEETETEQSIKKLSDNKKTISYLNSKVWYRFIKVVYLFLFLLIILISNGLILDGGISRLDLDRSMIYCKNGKILSLSQVDVYFSSNDFKKGFNYQDFSTRYSTEYDFEKIIKKCGSLTNEQFNQLKLKGLSNNQIAKFESGYNPAAVSNEIQSTLNLFDIKSVYTYNYFLQYFVIGNIVILLLFESIKRIFYYIALGTIKPTK